MKQTPSQFFCALMENQWQARYTDQQLLRLLEEFNQRKYRSGVKIVQQTRKLYNRGALPCQDSVPVAVPQYDKHSGANLVPVNYQRKGKK
jgi:hypothetical protein